MNKKILWGCFLLTAAAEIGSLFYLRGSYYSTKEEGTEYITPVSVNFDKNFYERNYITLHIPAQKAAWRGDRKPETEEAVYLPVRKDAENRLEIMHAQREKPAGDYIAARVKGVEGNSVTFDFPQDRLYMSAEDIQKIPVSELADRVQVRDEETGKTVMRMKNDLTARLRIKDGDVVIEDLLVNGGSVAETYTTVGKTTPVKYASSEADEPEKNNS